MMEKNYIDFIKHCNRCGERFTKQSDQMLICPQNHEFYINPKICTAALLQNHSGQILLVLRKAPPNAGHWDLPGGFVDVDETLEEGMQRELEEEIGVKAKNLTYFGSIIDNYMYQGIPYPTLNAIFTGLIDESNITIHDDIAGFHMFEKDSLPFDKIAFESFIPLLQKFAKNQ